MLYDIGKIFYFLHSNFFGDVQEIENIIFHDIEFIYDVDNEILLCFNILKKEFLEKLDNSELAKQIRNCLNSDLSIMNNPEIKINTQETGNIRKKLSLNESGNIRHREKWKNRNEL